MSQCSRITEAIFLKTVAVMVELQSIEWGTRGGAVHLITFKLLLNVSFCKQLPMPPEFTYEEIYF